MATGGFRDWPEGKRVDPVTGCWLAKHVPAGHVKVRLVDLPSTSSYRRWIRKIGADYYAPKWLLDPRLAPPR